MQSLTLIATLLRSNPEQEQNLLRLLVNKLVRGSFPLSLISFDDVPNHREIQKALSVPEHLTTFFTFYKNTRP